MKVYMCGAGGEYEMMRITRGYTDFYVESNNAFYRICAYTKERFLMEFKQKCERNVNEVQSLNHDANLILQRCDVDSVLKWAIAYRDKGYFEYEPMLNRIDLELPVECSFELYNILTYRGKYYRHISGRLKSEQPLYNEYDDVNALNEILAQLKAIGVNSCALTELTEVFSDGK